ncbi:MAG: ABC transporter permease [Myxococcota bacterium]
MLDLLSEIWESVARRPLRTATTAFGVFWGMFLLVVMLGAAGGLRNGIEALFSDDAATSVWVESGPTSLSHDGIPAGRRVELTIEDVAALEALPELWDVTPRHAIQTPVSAPKTGRSAGLPVLAIYPGYGTVERTHAWRGRLINELDVVRGRNVAILGQRAAEILFDQSEAAMGEWIDLGGSRFHIVGIFTDSGGDGEMRRVFIPYSSLANTFDASRRVSLIVAMSDPQAPPAHIRSRVRRLLARRHRFADDDQTALDVFVAMERYETTEQLTFAVELLVLIVGLGTLLTSLSGVSNILLVSVRERTREIGLRRALGASQAQIFAMILVEAVAISSVAGLIGTVLGLALLKAVREAEVRTEYFANPGVDSTLLFSLLGALVLCGGLAGIFPARQAVRKSPADALRDE